MQTNLRVEYNFPLKGLNSFGIDARAHAYVRVTTLAELQQALQEPALAALPRLLLGGGSNIVLTGDFAGLVLHMALKGCSIAECTEDTNYVRAAAGENWHDFVAWTLAQGLAGLENLALIPGTVGAAPIQNIGAYGAQIADHFYSLTVYDSASGATSTLDHAACRFAYRDSLFKHADGQGLVILDVTFALPRKWQAKLAYQELAQALAAQGLPEPDARQIFNAVIEIRRRKLPDPQVIGNAGSFFKNPLVSKQQCAVLLARFPALVHHAQADGGEKLAAGWLIDQCGWKGKRLGPAGVYDRQALVLVNHGGATGADITRLATAIADDVEARYGVRLEPEPVFV